MNDKTQLMKIQNKENLCGEKKLLKLNSTAQNKYV